MAEERDYNQREHMEQVIAEGGSVYHKGRIITRHEELPSHGVLARGDSEAEAAARRILVAKRAALDEELAALDSSVGEPNAPPVSVGDDLSSLTVVELKERAKEAGVEGYSTMNKADLVVALEAKQ